MISSGPYQSWQNTILHFLMMTKIILFVDHLYCVFPHIYSLSHAHVSTLHIFMYAHLNAIVGVCRCLQVSWVGGALAFCYQSLLSVSVRVCESECAGVYDNAPVLAMFSRTCMCVRLWMLLLCRSAWQMFDGCQARLRVCVYVCLQWRVTFDTFKYVWHSEMRHLSVCVTVFAATTAIVLMTVSFKNKYIPRILCCMNMIMALNLESLSFQGSFHQVQ